MFMVTMLCNLQILKSLRHMLLMTLLLLMLLLMLLMTLILINVAADANPLQLQMHPHNQWAGPCQS
jgi:hypothetical protein